MKDQELLGIRGDFQKLSERIGLWSLMLDLPVPSARFRATDYKCMQFLLSVFSAQLAGDSERRAAS